MTKGEYVEVTVQLDSEAVSGLKLAIQVQLNDEKELPAQKHTPLHTLGFIVMHEAIGTITNQAYLKAPIMWRGNIMIVDNTRKVYDKDMNIIVDEVDPNTTLNQLKANHKDKLEKWINKNATITERRSGIQMHKCEVELI